MAKQGRSAACCTAFVFYLQFSQCLNIYHMQVKADIQEALEKAITAQQQKVDCVDKQLAESRAAAQVNQKIQTCKYIKYPIMVNCNGHCGRKSTKGRT